MALTPSFSLKQRSLRRKRLRRCRISEKDGVSAIKQNPARSRIRLQDPPDRDHGPEPALARGSRRRRRRIRVCARARHVEPGLDLPSRGLSGGKDCAGVASARRTASAPSSRTDSNAPSFTKTISSHVVCSCSVVNLAQVLFPLAGPRASVCVHIYSLRPVALPADRQHILAPRDRLTDTPPPLRQFGPRTCRQLEGVSRHRVPSFELEATLMTRFYALFAVLVVMVVLTRGNGHICALFALSVGLFAKDRVDDVGEHGPRLRLGR
jgi:hypothetical protein